MSFLKHFIIRKKLATALASDRTEKPSHSERYIAKSSLMPHSVGKEEQDLNRKGESTTDISLHLEKTLPK